MDVVARFWYDPNNNERVSGFVNFGRFSDFQNELDESCGSNYSVSDVSPHLKNSFGLEILSFGNNPNITQFKEILGKVLSKNNEFFPISLSCKNRENYSLVEEVLSKENPNKKLSNGIYEFFFNQRFLLN